MKYALVLERTSDTCNHTAGIVASMGYLVTPVFSPKKALHAAHMIQFDLIVTCTASVPGDRRSLTCELARCSPQALLILTIEPGSEPTHGHIRGVNAIVDRPVTAQRLQEALGSRAEKPAPSPWRWMGRERRRRAVD
jgi:hypothetical protein